MEKLSVIVTTINDALATNMTLANILFQLEQDQIDYEVIIVDNGSSNEQKQILQAFMDYHKNFPLFYFEYDVKGTIPPHSFGVTKATGKYVTMPDPHIIFSPHYFRTIIDSLKKHKEQGVEVIFTPFGIGSITKYGGEYIDGSHLVKPNPFGRVTSVGTTCYYGDEPHPVLSCTLSSMICEREWLLKIGNMFPDAFINEGGHTAESLLVGITTWMFGKKCYSEPRAVMDHPVYRDHYGDGRKAYMANSMALGAYILGGEKYLAMSEQSYGSYLEGKMDEFRTFGGPARKYIEENAVMTLDYLVENWEVIKNG